MVAAEDRCSEYVRSDYGAAAEEEEIGQELGWVVVALRRWARQQRVARRRRLRQGGFATPAAGDRRGLAR